MSEVFATPELIASLSTYSESRQGIPSEPQNVKSTEREAKASVLFLRIIAAADYYTTNKTLMQDVPPVDVDIILDRFLLNVLPQSLLPTGAYLIILAIIAWFLANYIWHILSKVATSDAETVEKKQR